MAAPSTCGLCGREDATVVYISPAAERMNVHAECLTRWRLLDRTVKYKHLGISAQTVHEIFLAQDGKCAVCVQSLGDILPTKVGSWEFEIDYAEPGCDFSLHGSSPDTPYIRGLLCRRCRQLVGRIGHSIPRAVEAIRYLVRTWKDEKYLSAGDKEDLQPLATWFSTMPAPSAIEEPGGERPDVDLSLTSHGDKLYNIVISRPNKHLHNLLVRLFESSWTTVFQTSGGKFGDLYFTIVDGVENAFIELNLSADDTAAERQRLRSLLVLAGWDYLAVQVGYDGPRTNFRCEDTDIIEAS